MKNDLRLDCFSEIRFLRIEGKFYLFGWVFGFMGNFG